MDGVDPVAAVTLSLRVACWCVALDAPPALALGWLLARRNFPGKALVTTLVLAPVVMPPVVTGLLLLRLVGRRGVFGPALARLGVTVPFTPAACVLAAMAMGLPFFVLAARGAFEAVDPRLEELSWSLGVPPGRTFLRVTLPLVMPGVAAGAALAFARALGEFGATTVLAGNVEGQTRTLSLAVYTLLDAPGGDPAVRTLVAAGVGLSLAALAAYEALVRWQRRRLEHG